MGVRQRSTESNNFSLRRVACAVLGCILGTCCFNGYQQPLSNQFARLFAGSDTERRRTSLNQLPVGGPPAPIQKRLCSLVEVSKGQWIKNVYEKPHYVAATPRQGCPKAVPGQPWTTWEWHPFSYCDFARFDVDMFCQLAENQTIAFWGDSINLDVYLSLTHLLGVPKELPASRNHRAKLTSQVCKSHNVTLIGQKDYFLARLRDTVTSSDHKVPNVLILNRGAHYVEDDRLLAEMNNQIIPDIQYWYEQCQIEYGDRRKCLVLWRTTVPGHPLCSTYKEPVRSAQEIEERILAKLDPQANHWEDFKRQNQLVIENFRNQTKGSIVTHMPVLPAYEVNILRPDIHPGGRDCLHTCSPGDEVLSEMVLHAMRLHSR